MLLNWAVNSMPNISGHAPSTWVLGRGLRLPYNIFGQNAQLSLQTAATSDLYIMDHMRMLNIAQQSIIVARYDRSISSAFLHRLRSTATDPIQATYNLGDQVFYWRGNGIKHKSRWAMHWHGPAILIGFEGNNCWVSHRGTTYA